MRAVLLPAVISALLWAAPAGATTSTFNGSLDSDWNTPGNWSAGVPTPTDDAVIPVTKSVTLVAGPVASVKSLTVDPGASLSVSSNSLTLGTGASSFGSGFVLSASTLNIGGPVTWSAGDIHLDNNSLLNITAGGTLDAHGDMAITLNTGAPQFHILAGGAFTRTAGSGEMAIGVQMEVDGSVTNSSGTLGFGVNNNAATDSGTWTVTAPGVLLFYGNTIVDLVSPGSMGGTGTVRVQPGGKVTAGAGTTFNPGTLSFEGGDVTLDTSATVGALAAPGGGGVRAGSGTLDTGTGAQELNGINFGGGTNNINGPVALTGGFAGSGGSVVNLNEDVTWTAGGIALGNSALLNIPSGTTLDAKGNQGFSVFAGSPLVHIHPGGAFTHTAGAGVTTMGARFEVDGLLSNSVGTLEFDVDNSPGVTDSGTWSVASPGVLRFYGDTIIDLVAPGSMGGTGTVRIGHGGQVVVPPGATFNPETLSFEGGIFTANADVTVPTIASPGGGGVRAGSGTLDTGTGAQVLNGINFGGGTSNINGPVALTGGFAGTGGSIVNLNEDVTWTANGIPLGDAAVINVGALLDLQGDHGISIVSGNPRLNVLAGGELRRSSGTGTAALGIPVGNAGTVAVQTGQMSVDSLTQTAGLTSVASGATLGGPVGLQGGTLRGLGTVAGSVTNSGGTVAPGTSPGKLTIDGDYAQGAGGRLDVEIDGLVQDTLYDRLAVGGAATLGGTLAILTGAFDPPGGSAYAVLTATGGVSGDFATQTGSTAGNKTYSRQVGANDVTLSVTAGPPPPSGGTPAISGTAQSGQTLTCSPGTWTGSPSSYSYEWLRDGAPISGATVAQYAVTDADVGSSLACRVVAHGPGGDSAPATSAPVMPTAAPVTPTPTATPAPAATPASTAAPTPAPPPAEPANLKAADVLQLPSARKCVSRRRFRIHMLRPAGVTLVKATVVVNGKRVKVVKGARLSAIVDLRGLPRGTFRVKITVVTGSGRKLSSQRKYRTCRPKRR